MQQPNNSREKKIKFLKGLLAGTATIKDAPRGELTISDEVWLTTDDETYENMTTHQIVTRAELDIMHKGKDVITFR